MDSRKRGLEAAAAIGVALALDAVLGEPPAALHPVVWLGKLADAAERGAPRRPAAQLAYGFGMALALSALAAAAGIATQRGTARLRPETRVLVVGAALMPAFALRGLLRAGSAVEGALRQGDLALARAELRSLVSRDTAKLDEGLIASAAIESLAENLTDSVAAPLAAFALCGLPGAYAYRTINTLDSMFGYRGRYEWLGKAAARLDDAVNLLPARVSALLICAVAPLAGGSPAGAFEAVRRDRSGTASPNAGWTMAALAGALGVRLEKAGHYVLNAAAPTPRTGDIARARRLTGLAAAGAALSCAGLAAAVARLRR